MKNRMKTYVDYIKQVEAFDRKVRAFVHFDKAKIEENAKAAKSGILNGITVAIKDNICVKDEPTTCASRILKDFRPPYDAAVITKLRNAGAVLFGKVNMDEFAFGSSCETSCYGPTYNPWDLKRIPGGSSGGSAASVASGMARMAIGSDTGGSIRQPAALCGIVGMKPTYGCVSRYGLIAFASSLDQIGPLTKNVSDAALLLTAIAGYDPKDSTSIAKDNVDYQKSLVKDVKGLKIGIPKECFIEGLDKDVEASIRKSIDIYRGLGAQVIDISLPHMKYSLSCYYIIAPAEASSNLARYDGVEYGLRGNENNGIIEMYTDTRTKGFGNEAKRRILLGTYVLSSGYYEAYYLKAQKVRTFIINDFKEVFKDVDCILTPTSPTPAFMAGERINDPLSMYLSDIFTIPANLAGIPGISIPCGFTEDGLPIGLQLLANHFQEEILFRAAYTFEQNTDFHTREPKL